MKRHASHKNSVQDHPHVRLTWLASGDILCSISTNIQNTSFLTSPCSLTSNDVGPAVYLFSTIPGIFRPARAGGDLWLKKIDRERRKEKRGGIWAQSAKTNSKAEREERERERHQQEQNTYSSSFLSPPFHSPSPYSSPRSI